MVVGYLISLGNMHRCFHYIKNLWLAAIFLQLLQRTGAGAGGGGGNPGDGNAIYVKTESKHFNSTFWNKNTVKNKTQEICFIHCLIHLQ